MAQRTLITYNAPSPSSSSDTSTPLAITETGSPSPPRASSELTSTRRSSLSRLFAPLSSGTSTLAELPPPLPLAVERDAVRVFDTGPRMSNNYRNLGFRFGGDLGAAAGVPLRATISFETSGGTGALLIAKDPIHRHSLRHRGILKAYFLAHRDYIFQTYGHAEDVDMDEMVMIYGQDCTSDWACAVTLEAERGAKVEFEVFQILETGVWGEWKTACSASQRGPHRAPPVEHTSRIPSQTIVVKRLTIQTRRFRSTIMRASAEPKDDPHDRRKQKRISWGKVVGTDPLQLVHDYILQYSRASHSVASDDDALTLLNAIGSWEDEEDLRRKVVDEARRKTKIKVDEDGLATLLFLPRFFRPSFNKTSTTDTSLANPLTSHTVCINAQ